MLERRIAQVAQRQFSLVTTEQLRGMGLSDRAISSRVRSGRLVRERRRVYRVPGAAHVRERSLLAAQLAVPGSALSHRSAGWLWDIKGVRPGRPELTIPAGRSTRLNAAIVYRSRTISARDVTTKGPFDLTTPSRTLCDLAAVLSDLDLEVAVDSSVAHGIVSLPDLQARVAVQRRGAKGAARLRRIVCDRLANGTPASHLETRALRALRAAKLPRPVSQFEVRRSDGSFVARPDLVYPDVRLAIELDGDEYHSTRDARRRDLARQNDLIHAGYAVLRFGDDAVRSGGFTRSVRRYLRSR